MSETAETRTEEAKPEAASFFVEIKEFVKAVAWAVGIAIFLRSFVVEAYKIPSGSMLPTLEIGDHIFVNKFLYGFQIPLTTHKVLMWRNPHRGDVVVFKFPLDTEKDYIKRVIGEPGDLIDMVGEDLYVNGVKQDAEALGEIEVTNDSCLTGTAQLFEEHLDTGISHSRITLLGGSHLGKGPWKVPEGEFFAMGDNRDNSADSRTGWTVPYSYVKGKAMFVWLSWDSCADWPRKIRFNRFGKRVR